MIKTSFKMSDIQQSDSSNNAAGVSDLPPKHELPDGVYQGKIIGYYSAKNKWSESPDKDYLKFLYYVAAPDFSKYRIIHSPFVNPTLGSSQHKSNLYKLVQAILGAIPAEFSLADICGQPLTCMVQNTADKKYLNIVQVMKNPQDFQIPAEHGKAWLNRDTKDLYLIPGFEFVPIDYRKA
jgi:hypothetical protein